MSQLSDENDNDTFKILIATDNHLGYLEKDPIRGQDSFNAFEEILQIADAEKVDFILLGGDLFHHNRPSRSCIYQTMKMLRRHCFGDRPSKVWIASDQSINFPDEFATANYLDENLNVSIPVFSIHGNHDDPSGVGNLCALHLLSVAGMVNYFGASSSVEDVVIQPILMQKGDTRLALYGLGNIREERLHRQWRAGRVKFMRPQPEEDGEHREWLDTFNLFVFHQNRARHGPTSHIPEEFLDSFLDLVFWGHEHECRITPEEFHSFAVTQPGSSVATSLSQGESEPKYVGLLQINKHHEYSLDKIRLRTVRPFQFTSVSLSRVETLRPSDHASTQSYLEDVVESLIERARIDWEEQQREAYRLENLGDIEMPLPLIRIRVDYSGGFEKFNPQQFGHKFINRVANPKDMLMFQKLHPEERNSRRATDIISDVTIAIPERLDNLRVENLVSEMLSNDLTILPETGLEEAVMSLVEKNDKDAIRNFVTRSVTLIRNNISDLTEDQLTEEYIKRKASELKESSQQQDSLPSLQTNNNDIALRSIPESQNRQIIDSTATHVINDIDNDIAIIPTSSATTSMKKRRTELITSSQDNRKKRRQTEIEENDDYELKTSQQFTRARGKRAAVSSSKQPQKNSINSSQTSYIISSGSEEEDNADNNRDMTSVLSVPAATSSQITSTQERRRRVLPSASQKGKR
ncbi:Metallo-dependent phosphatase-like protein [Cokeromyces recurvatus]|uniref:Metallo-dependent phosphatase-like protein n=1 Tax=Cokeromyces recurvatus TaxID=90255 RepID=UPI00221E58CD|nr:Metallo-dependent phosphatase-like protein [Cokeromyces recurvatus]KAI7898478.1 Metallo-dependent phosphatase-like protein [Cokeromyces recurvatus]